MSYFLSLTGILGVFSNPVWADTRMAVVIGVDPFRVDSAGILLEKDYDVIELSLGDVGLRSSLRDLQSSTGIAAVVLSGGTRIDDSGQVQMTAMGEDGAGVALADLLARMDPNPPADAVLVLDICGNASSVAALDDLSADVDVTVLRPDPMPDCVSGAPPHFLDATSHAIAQPGLLFAELTAVLKDAGQGVRRSGPEKGAYVVDPERLLGLERGDVDHAALADMPPLDRAEHLWSLARDRPVRLDVAVATARLNALPTGERDRLVLATTSPRSVENDDRLALARPPAGDLLDLGPRPAPSILVGPQPGTGGGDPVEEGQTSADVDVVIGSRGDRVRLRDSDPDLFVDLLAKGVFDPADGDLERALQTELQAMDCYSGGIDGDWGPGSRRAARSYAAQRGVRLASEAAEIDLYRLILEVDVRCPARVSQPGPKPPQEPTTTRTEPAQPAPASNTASGFGTGIFR